MSTQSPRRFSRYDFATGLIDTERATVLDLDRIDPASLPSLMDDVLAGRKLWGPWRDSPFSLPAQVFLGIAAIAELLLVPLSLGNLMTVMVDPAGVVTPPTVALVVILLAALLVMMVWLMFGAGGVTGADAAISLSVKAAQGDDESIDRVRARWADVRGIPGVRGEDVARVRTLAYNAQVEAACHLHMRTAGGDAAELRGLAKTRDAAMKIFDAEVDRLEAEADRRQHTKKLETQIRAAAQITSARTSGVAPVAPEPDGILADDTEEPVGNAHNSETVTRYEQPPRP